MPDVCTLPQSWEGHEFDSHAPCGYGLPCLLFMDHREVFDKFFVKLSLEKKKTNTLNPSNYNFE